MECDDEDVVAVGLREQRVSWRPMNPTEVLHRDVLPWQHRRIAHGASPTGARSGDNFDWRVSRTWPGSGQCAQRKTCPMSAVDEDVHADAVHNIGIVHQVSSGGGEAWHIRVSRENPESCGIANMNGTSVCHRDMEENWVVSACPGGDGDDEKHSY